MDQLDEYKKFYTVAIILFSSFFFISTIITSYFYIVKKDGKISCNCNFWNFLVFFCFNCVIGIIFTLPYITVYDYFIYFMELLKIEEKDYDKMKQLIKKIYKFVHWFFYLLSDLFIPFFFNILIIRYYNSNNTSNNKYKCSCKTFKIFLESFAILLIVLILFIILIIVIVVVFSEPEVNKSTEECQGFDGIMFNIRNIIAVAELEYNIIFFYLYSIIIVYHYFSALVILLSYLYNCLCSISLPSYTPKQTFKFYKIGKLIEKNKNENDNDNNNDDDIIKALKELNYERREDIKKKLIQQVNDSKNCSKRYCYCFCIPKFIIDIPIGIFIVSITISLAFIEIANTFSDTTTNNYSTIQKEWEEEENRENIKKGIFKDLDLFFVLSYLYNIAMIFSIVKRKYFNEYMPYINSSHNEIAFLLLLKYIAEVACPVYFLIFFPFFNNDHRAIIYSYFHWYLFNIENYWQMIIKGLLLLIIPILICKGCIPNYIMEYNFNQNEYHVKEGEKACDQDSLSRIELKSINFI